MKKSKLTIQEKENLAIHCKEILREKKQIKLKEKIAISVFLLEQKLAKIFS